MRTIGLLGGMSWYSTLEYYRVINTEVGRRLGGHSSAKIVMSSLDFAEVRAAQLAPTWDRAAAMMAGAASALEVAGADVIVLCTNLMHKTAPAIEAALTSIPLLHIADAVAGRALQAGYSTVGLMATRPVMEESFYADRLAARGISVIVPNVDERAMIDGVIFDELTQGVVADGSRERYVAVSERLAGAGAQAIVEACTEIELLLRPSDTPIPLIDSMQAHALAAVEFALSD